MYRYLGPLYILLFEKISVLYVANIAFPGPSPPPSPTAIAPPHQDGGSVNFMK